MILVGTIGNSRHPSQPTFGGGDAAKIMHS